MSKTAPNPSADGFESGVLDDYP